MTVNAYYIRCRAADVPAIKALGVLLGLLEVAPDGTHIAAAGEIVWSEVGWLRTADDTDWKRDPEGNPWWHANLYTPFRVLDAAEDAAGANPAIAAALADIPRYFLTDDAGEPVSPATPYRVLYGVSPSEPEDPARAAVDAKPT